MKKVPNVSIAADSFRDSDGNILKHVIDVELLVHGRVACSVAVCLDCYRHLADAEKLELFQKIRQSMAEDLAKLPDQIRDCDLDELIENEGNNQ